MNLNRNKELKHVSNINKMKIDDYSYSLRVEKILTKQRDCEIIKPHNS